MSNPLIKELEQGTYYWCTCGKTKTSPFCDGAHKGTTAQPLPFVVAEKKQVALCNCGRTKTPPYCDGTHTKK